MKRGQNTRPQQRKKGKHGTQLPGHEEKAKNHRIQQLHNFLRADSWTCKSIEELSLGGFGSRELRRKIWNKLLFVLPKEIIDYKKIIKEHKYTDQIDKDVVRSLTKLVGNSSPQKIEELRKELRDIMNGIFSIHDNLHYYQGFNDICSIALLELGPKNAFGVVERLSMLHLSDAMNKSFDSTRRILFLIYTLLEMIDPVLYNHLKSCDLQPFFCISWIITWFAHDIDDSLVVSRLFDFIISTHPLMPIYLGMELIMSQRQDILGTEAEYSSLHHKLHNLPEIHPPIDDWIKNSYELYKKVPPLIVMEKAKESPDSLVSIKKYPYTRQSLIQAKDKDPTPQDVPEGKMEGGKEEKKPWNEGNNSWQMSLALIALPFVVSAVNMLIANTPA